MRVPVSWLRDYVPIEMPLGELATRLSISTAEVEGIERRGVVTGSEVQRQEGKSDDRRGLARTWQ